MGNHHPKPFIPFMQFRDMKRLPVFLLVAIILIPSVISFADTTYGAGLRAAPPGDSIGPTVKEWTLLVYMCNDNSVTLPADKDIEEMESAEADANIIVLYDGNGTADSRLFSIENGKEIDLTAPFFSTEINTGSPFQLTDFVVWGMENYPSRHVWVDLWGHGNGWSGGFRDIHPSDILTPSEMGKAFQDIYEKTDRKVNILTFDACRMGAMSVLYELQGKVDYVLSSEKDVPEEGLPYTEILNNLSPSPEKASQTIVDKYVRWASRNSDYSVTYSSANMSRFPEFLHEFNSYMALATSLLPYRYSNIWDARNRTEKYEAPSMYDLRHFIKNMRSVDYLLDGTGKELMEEYNRTFFEMHYSNPVPQNGIRAKNAGGMSIYFPVQTFWDYTSQNFYKETEWGPFLAAMEKRYSPGSREMSVNYTIERHEMGTGAISLSIDAGNDTEGLSAIAYLIHDGEVTDKTAGFPNMSIQPEGPGNYSVLVYLWKNNSLYNEKDLKVEVTAVLRLYGLVHTTSGKTLVSGITITNPETGNKTVVVSNESGYAVSLDMPSFCNMGDRLEISTSIGGREVVQTITVSHYIIRSNFIVIDGYNTTNSSGQEGGQNSYLVMTLGSLNIIATGLIAIELMRRRK